MPKNMADRYGNSIEAYILFLTDFKTMEKLSGQPVFAKKRGKGPDGLPTNAKFNHYNKKFVEWAVENAIPAAKDKAFREKTASIYKDYLANTAEIFLRAIYGLESNPKKYAAMQKQYLDAMNQEHFYGPESFIAGIMDGLPEKTGITDCP